MWEYKNKIIGYFVVFLLLIVVLRLLTPKPETTDDFPHLPDRSQQSEMERGAGIFRDTKAVKDWAKKNIPDE